MTCESALLFAVMHLTPAILVDANGKEIKSCESRCSCEAARVKGRRISYQLKDYWLCYVCGLEYDLAMGNTAMGCCPVCGDEIDIESGHKVLTCDRVDEEHFKYRRLVGEKRIAKRLDKWNVLAKAAR
jgi:hypothetical protein